MFHYLGFKVLGPLFPIASMLQISENRYNSTLRYLLRLDYIFLYADLKLKALGYLRFVPSHYLGAVDNRITTK